MTTTIETAEEQRARVLADQPATNPMIYDLAVELGYVPESWDGMWKLVPQPFTYENGKVMAEEVVATINGVQQTIKVAHDLPSNWNVVEDVRFTGETTAVFYRPSVR